MMGCLILDHPKVSILTKVKMLRFMFHDEEYEIQVIQRNTVVIYLWNIDKMKIWQAAADFQATDIFAGFGFGNRKKTAYEVANRKLEEMKI